MDIFGNRSRSAPTTPVLESPVYDGSIFMVVNGKRLDSYKPESNYVRSTAKVDQDTMYRVTFKEHGKEDWAWCRASPVRHKECIENFGSGATKIESTSVMKNDFRHHEHPERAELHRPQPENSVEGGTFHSDTSYKTDFKQKQITPIQAIKPKEYKAPTARFEGKTTVKSDYTPHPGHKREPAFRPPVNHQPSKVQFDGSTTTSEAYREWPAQQMEKPSWARQKAYEPAPGSNVYSSSYQSDFLQPKKFERVKPLKPTPQDKDLLHGPPDSNVPKVTHYMEKFVPFTSTNPAKSFKMHQVYETPKEKFTGESVYQANYAGERASPAQPIVPNQRRNSDEAPRSIDFHTTYKGTYKAERPASCPAKELMTASDEFGHIGFRNGHQYYVQRSPRRCKTPNHMDPIFPSKPESQKTDRERSSSRPSSARKSPRSPSKTDQRASTRSSRPTTPRQPSTRPKSATKTTPQASPRNQETKTSPRANSNNSNGNVKGAKTGNTTVKSVPKKANTKPGNMSNSNSKPATSSPKRNVPTAARKMDTDKSVSNANNSNSNVPPPIKPPKKVGKAPEENKITPNLQGVPQASKEATKISAPAVSKTSETTATTVQPITSTVPTKTTESKAVPRPVNKISAAAATTPKAAAIAQIPSKPVSSTAPEAPAPYSPANVAKTPMPAVVSTSPAIPPVAPAKSAPARENPSVLSQAPPPVTRAAVPVTPELIAPSKASPAAAPPKPEAVKPTVSSVSVLAPVTTGALTSAPAPSTTATPPTVTAPSPPASSTTPKLKQPAAPAKTDPMPVLAPTPVLPPAPPVQPVELLDLSALEDKLLAGKTTTPKAPEPVNKGDQMPVIAPPPAPAQPVVRTGGIQHDTNLMQ